MSTDGTTPGHDFDWEGLRAEAVRISAHAYVPYSHFPVGAAAVADDGRMVSGCNVENAAYGATLCAECGVVSSLAATGGGRLTHFVCVNARGEVIMPCGRCRQLLFELGACRGNALALIGTCSAAGWSETARNFDRTETGADEAQQRQSENGDDGEGIVDGADDRAVGIESHALP